MTLRRLNLLALLLAWATMVAMLIPSVGSIMHDNDQASALAGIIQLARGDASPLHPGFYMYDKQYLTYWLPALLVRAFPKTDPVALTNVFTFGFWWGTLLILCLGAIWRSVAVIWVLTVITAPAILIHSPFLAGNFISAGFLNLAIALQLRNTGRAKWGLWLICLVCAVGARADALLVLPLLAWLACPVSSARAFLLRPLTWLAAACGAVALIVGAVVAGRLQPGFVEPMRDGRVYAAYLVFGLGGAGISLIGSVLGISRGILIGRSLDRRLFRAIGCAALILPFVFYSFQMFSTRYWVVVLTAVLAFATCTKGQAILHLLWRNKFWDIFGVVTLLAAVVPLIVGLHLPFPDKPSLSLGAATRFPSSDGMLPMGNYAGFLLARGEATAGAVDHNQSLWLAARSVGNWETNENGMVPILDTPMRRYLNLAVVLNGKRSETTTNISCFAYADVRSLLRLDPAFAGQGQPDIREVLRSRKIDVISDGGATRAIVRIGKEEGSGLPLVYDLSRMLEGNDFEIMPLECMGKENELIVSRADEGHTLVLFGGEPFVVTLGGNINDQSSVASLTVDDGACAVALKGAQWYRRRILIPPEMLGGLVLARSVLPDYMSVKRFK